MMAQVLLLTFPTGCAFGETPLILLPEKSRHRFCESPPTQAFSGELLLTSAWAPPSCLPSTLHKSPPHSRGPSAPLPCLCWDLPLPGSIGSGLSSSSRKKAFNPYPESSQDQSLEATVYFPESVIHWVSSNTRSAESPFHAEPCP